MRCNVADALAAAGAAMDDTIAGQLLHIAQDILQDDGGEPKSLPNL